MNKRSFKSWLARRDAKIPVVDRIIPIVVEAGARGMTRGRISGVIEMDRDSLDEFLDGLVRGGLLTMTVDDGLLVYRGRL